MAEEAISLKYYSENTLRQKYFATRDLLRKHVLTPPEWLEGMESPFKWGLHIHTMEFVNWNITDKLYDYVNQGAFYGFERFGLLLSVLLKKIIDNEEGKFIKEESESDESVDENNSSEDEDIDEFEPEKIFTICKETVDEMAINEGDVIYSRIGPALQHVLLTTRAHMLFCDGRISESQELARNIQLVEDMSQKCKAGLEGLRARVVMTRVQNYTIVLPYLHRAEELDPEFGYWPYLIGKVLRRARREFEVGEIEEELEYFKKAVSLERNPKFLVFLAQAYQETALKMFHSGEPIDSVNSFLQNSVKLYSECWQLKNDSPAIARRVGNGMMKMRSEFINKTVAKEALLKAVELSPNICTHVALGKFYYIHEGNDEKALEQFEKAHPSPFGIGEIIRLNIIKDSNYDPHDILQIWLKHEESAVKQYKAFCDAAWYYLVFKRDLDTAAKYIWRVLEKDTKSIRAKKALNYRSYPFCVDDPINLIEVIVNEILLLKERNQSLPLEDQKDMELLTKFLEKFLEKYPELSNITPKPNLVEELKQNVERRIAYKRRKRYGYQNRRSESSRELEEPGSWRNQGPSNIAQENSNQQPYRRLDGDGNRRHNHWYNPINIENNERSQPQNRHSFSLGVDEGRNRGYSRRDRRYNSESHSGWRDGSNCRGIDDRERTADQSESNRRFTNNNRGRTDRQYNNFNNNRYDVTISDWRSENRK